MLQINTQSDPIVEILRLAYRRGLAIQQAQKEENKGQEPSREIEEASPVDTATAEGVISPLNKSSSC